MSFSEDTTEHFVSEIVKIKEAMVPMGPTVASPSPFANGVSGNPQRRGMPQSAVPAYAKGGVVKYRKGGKIVRVAEKGDEAIVPLAKKEKAKRMAKAILQRVNK